MPIFHEQALRAAADQGKDLNWLRPEHLASLSGLAAALDRLCPEQRCDAIYADWVLRLNDNRHLILPLRDYLIGDGALDANYLAELAQNADDASIRRGAEIRVNRENDWLFVSNNGRKADSRDLLGLCRFFVHGVELTQETIGRFGIGFKSCYRIASEVYVHSWDGADSMGFRLPICRPGDQASVPEPQRLDRLLTRLKGVGVACLDDELRQVACLGYCTPEYLAQLPAELAQATQSFRDAERGTVFCFHLRKESQQEVASRITGQEKELYELCPLFLPNLRLVQLSQHELRMSVGQRDEAHDCQGAVEADKVTLTTRDLTDAVAPASNSRFWRLRGVAEGDLWQIALHADSSFRLRVEQEEDEQGATIKDGSAYAFFPLNGVNWPFRLHLHVRLPTNLARSDWNPDDAPEVEEQIRHAIRGLTAWLNLHSNKWHPAWRLGALIDRIPNQAEHWARLVFDCLREELKQAPLLKSLWGSYHTTQDALTVRIAGGTKARRNWLEFCAKLTVPGLGSDFPLVQSEEGDVDMGLTPISANKLRAFFERAAGQANGDPAFWRGYVAAAFSAEDLSPDSLETVCKKVPVEHANAALSTLGALLNQWEGATLAPEWHELFRSVATWLKPEDRANHSVCGWSIRDQLLKLSEPAFNPDWSEVPTVLASLEAWEQSHRGDQFWKSRRSPCPRGQQNVVIQSIQVRVGNGVWRPVAEVWLLESHAPECFHGILQSFGVGRHNQQLADVRNRLREWDLWEAWEDAAEAVIRRELARKLKTCLVKSSESLPGIIQLQTPIERTFTVAHTRSRDALPARWKSVVGDTEVAALAGMLAARQAELGSKKWVSSRVEPPALRKVLALWGEYAIAPWWLTEGTVNWFVRVGLWEPNQYSMLGTTDLQQVQRRRELARALLANFHKWEACVLTEEQAVEIQKLCVAEPETLRGNWSIGLTSKTTELLRNLLDPDGVLPDGPVGTDAGANLPLLKHPDRRWLGVHVLPPALRRIPAIAKACLQPHDLNVGVSTEGACLPITDSDVETGTRQDALFQALRRAYVSESLLGCRGKINVRWSQAGQPVAELLDAPFAVRDGRMVTSRTTLHIDDSQFNRALALYSLRAPGNADFQQRFQQPGLDHAGLYEVFRDKIVATLLETEVEDLGYRERDVIRELLQNAESAYDSKPGGLPAERDFEFVLRPSANGNFWEAVSSHSGRCFNEAVRMPDGRQEARNDIQLIVSAPRAEEAPTEGWIGRFHRGFKAIFTVTEIVQVRSGPYEFSIRDLLLLHPATPTPAPERFSPRTSFSFRCTRQAGFKLLHLPNLDGAQQPLRVFNASTFVFLQQTNRVRVQADRFAWEWRIRSSPFVQGWTEIAIQQSHPQSSEQFLVFCGELPPGHGATRGPRYSVALRINGGADAWRPIPLGENWRRIRLTFETEDPFPLDIIVNGDFETDSGRLGIRKSGVNERLLAASLEAAGQLCNQVICERCGLDDWLAWADVFHLRDGEEQLCHQFDPHHATLVGRFRNIRELLCTHIPGPNGFGRADPFRFPSPLVRRLSQFVQHWGFSAADWIDPRIEERLPRSFRDQHEKVTLNGLVGSLSKDDPMLRTMETDFQGMAFQIAMGNLDAVDGNEFRLAKRMLEEMLLPADGGAERTRPVELWTAERLWQWWRRQGASARLYTLDGENWPLLFPDDNTPESERRDRLHNNLSQPGSEAGRRTWYRLLGLACLMSAAWGRSSTLRDFWQNTLERVEFDFWERTAGNDFSKETKELFSQLVSRTHPNVAASGEAAEFWRHVFYDVRKVHELVFGTYRFAETVWQLASDPVSAGELPHFLRSGHLVGQWPWAGVLGQSAGAPIFFVVRELCRLGIVSGEALEKLRPLAFFACTPVRRAAARIGWIDAALAAKTDFESVAEVSEELHKHISEDLSVDDDTRRQLLDLYDIPLLHLGVTE